MSISLIGNYGLASITQHNSTKYQEYITNKNVSRNQKMPVIDHRSEEQSIAFSLMSNQLAIDLELIRPNHWTSYSPHENNNFRLSLNNVVDKYIDQLKTANEASESTMSNLNKMSTYIKAEIEIASDYWMASKVLISEVS